MVGEATMLHIPKSETPVNSSNVGNDISMGYQVDRLKATKDPVAIVFTTWSDDCYSANDYFNSTVIKEKAIAEGLVFKKIIRIRLNIKDNFATKECGWLDELRSQIY
nr:hypothetical protein Iba_chr10eCG9570 [Ipomoea batatas]